MTLAPGARLGPYEVIAPVGAGGMGEVYRARDPRIGRDVAIKVLPAAYSRDPERLRRFEQEVRAAGALNHPNILTIYDVGTHEGSPYIVSELLEGETLRERLADGALPQRKALEFAMGVAHGLAAAHAKGVTHRDLKPENIFLTRDARVKILDFGLAKLTQPEPAASATSAPTKAAETQAGTVLGTVGYMAPEQVRGQPLDHRADIFTFGAILHEMLAGERAFQGVSPVEVMNAILKDEPPELAPPAVGRIIRHCLEKNAEERFQSARDLAFDLESLLGHSVTMPAPPVSPGVSRRRVMTGLGAAALAASYGGVYWLGRRGRAPVSNPVFRRVTFRRGVVWSGRFSSDGNTVVYSALWDGDTQPRLFTTRVGSTESRPLDIPSGDVLSISPSGEMLLLLGRNQVAVPGMLARAPLAGGVPREILEQVVVADWAPDGTSFAVIRRVTGGSRLEFPAGKTLYETANNLQNVRFSPRGDWIGFVEEAGASRSISIVDRNGSNRTLAPGRSLSWSPDGRELWFTEGVEGPRTLRAVSLTGEVRPLLAGIGEIALFDVSRQGLGLLRNNNWKGSLRCRRPGETTERDLSWLDFTEAADLAADGKTILFTETRDGGGRAGGVYLRKTDGAPPVRLGDGVASALSPDGKWVVATTREGPRKLLLLPTGPGESRTLAGENLHYSSARWFPDGQRILVHATEPGRRPRLYVLAIKDSSIQPLTPEGTGGGMAISPDGQQVATLGPDRKAVVCPVAGGDPRPVPGVSEGEAPVQWGADHRTLYLRGPGAVSVNLYRLDLQTGRRELWKKIVPPDPAGLEEIRPVLVTPDGRAYAYSCRQYFDELYVVEGLR